MKSVALFTPSYPKMLVLPGDLAALVCGHYRFGALYSATPLHAAGWNSVFRLDTSGGLFVLRISYSHREESQLLFEHRLIDGLTQKLSYVPRVLLTNDGVPYFIWQSRAVSLFDYAVGNPCNPRSESTRIACATALGSLHAAAHRNEFIEDRLDYPRLSLLPWATNRMWDWDDVQALLDEDGRTNVRLFERFEGEPLDVLGVLGSLSVISKIATHIQDWIQETSSSKLPVGPIHGDFAPRNILMKSDIVAAVIDWDDCQVEWLAWDLAKAIWEFCRADDPDCPEPMAMMSFWKSYEASFGQPVVRGYTELLHFVWAVRCIEILYALGDALRGDRWYPANLMSNLRALARLEDLWTLSTKP